ncbi:MAG: BlaI/MecI/CopY family transcriptional regulator [Candidatus Eremiobacteraeota bacterium]|nr:BlaI/MecI/CopY family transcriptional regulator [Candidatus Eremiobacteraeota bacterium]
MSIESRYSHLGELELEIMDVLWDFDFATVKDIHETLVKKRDIAYTTVMTVMTRLAEKGMLKRSQSGRTYVYRPKYSRTQIAHTFFDRIKEKIFRGRPAELFSYIIASSSLTSDDLLRIKLLIEEKERQTDG